MKNIINLITDMMEEIIKNYNLDYGNAYIDVNDEDISYVIEAPNMEDEEFFQNLIEELKEYE